MATALSTDRLILQRAQGSTTDVCTALPYDALDESFSRSLGDGRGDILMMGRSSAGCFLVD
jgi:hypothetical protein